MSQVKVSQVSGTVDPRWSHLGFSKRRRLTKPRQTFKEANSHKMSSAGQVVGGAQLDWGNLFFQYRDVHCHVKYEWKDGEWSQGEEVKDPYMKMHVMANVFHYGQALFEGQKAFHCKDGKVRIFNDCANYARMMSGCERMGMPSMPQEMFHDAIDRATRANLDFVPPYGSNGPSMPKSRDSNHRSQHTTTKQQANHTKL
jgi:hypothetical protein